MPQAAMMGPRTSLGRCLRMRSVQAFSSCGKNVASSSCEVRTRPSGVRRCSSSARQNLGTAALRSLRAFSTAEPPSLRWYRSGLLVGRLMRSMGSGFSSWARMALAWALSGCVVHEYAGPPANGRFRQEVHVSAEGALVRSALNTNRCLDAKGGRAIIKGEVWLYDCHGRDNQRWSFVDLSNGGVAIE